MPALVSECSIRLFSSSKAATVTAQTQTAPALTEFYTEWPQAQTAISNLHNLHLREQNPHPKKAKQNANQTLRTSRGCRHVCATNHMSVKKSTWILQVFFSFFIKKMGRFGARDPWPPRGQGSVFWHLQAKLKFWAAQSIKPPTRGWKDHKQVQVQQAEAKVFIWFWSSRGVT